MAFHVAPQRFLLADDTLAWPLGEQEAAVTVRNAIIIENLVTGTFRQVQQNSNECLPYSDLFCFSKTTCDAQTIGPKPCPKARAPVLNSDILESVGNSE